jgi:drug/metabolite transporter (DMT)-like permease
VSALRVASRRGAYAALAVLTLIWGSNWIVMKFALLHAHPVVFNAQRTSLAIVTLFGVLALRGGPLRPPPWRALLVTALFQTTINFGSTVMALAGGGAGRTSVLVFTMPFWTLVIAWPILHERVRGAQWVAIVLAFIGLVLIVDPTTWHGDLTPKLWAVLSGFGWAAGTVAMKYFQRDGNMDVLNFIAWQMLVGSIPFFILPVVHDFPSTQWSAAYVGVLFIVAVVATAFAFLVWIDVLRWLPAGTASLNMFAVPVIALLSSMAVFGERLSRNEWTGIACVGAGLCVLTALALRGRVPGAGALTPQTPGEGG